MKLLTLNTHSLLEDDYEQKLGQFTETVCREKPDLIALQEVNQTAGAPQAGQEMLEGWFPCPGSDIPIREDNHAAQVAMRLRRAGVPCAWTWVSAKIGYGKYDEGMAFLCIGREIAEAEAFYISGCQDYGNWKTRKALGIRAGGCDDWFYTVHMGWWQDEDEPFERQWRRLNDALEQKKQDGTVWLLGDFNSPAQFHGQGYDCIRSDGWQDTYQLAGQKDSGITVEGCIDGWRQEGQEAADEMRLDYIWCSRPAAVLSSNVIFNGQNGPKVSDHFGILAKVIEGSKQKRSAGILLPVSSLPSKYGIGCFSQSAYDFVDWLARAGQSYWQILPLGPTGYGDSPYQSFSTFAGNPYFISLEALVQEGVLTAEECDRADFGGRADDIDYEKLYASRYPLLRKAYERSRIGENDEYLQFAEENKGWLPDYALFMALKNHFGGISWNEWPEDIRLRQPEAMHEYGEKLYFEMEFQRYMQFQFWKQWKALKAYANRQGIRLIGDIPIYVAMDSADTWAHPELFQLDAQNVPIAVAGCPPDGFSATGQLWGNPLYRWEYHKETGYEWWVSRLAYCFRMYDVVRIDHFRGFDEYYSIPYGAESAVDGHWEKGPGIDLFRCVEKRLGRHEVIAEDLGYVTDSVRKLVRDSGFPGMKVLEFAFDSRDTGSASDYLPHNYTENCVAYTGTHDNETIAGWFHSITEEERQAARAYLCDSHTPQDGLYWSFIALIMRSSAKMCIIPMQDYLGLDNSCRLNQPSTVGKNWRWRVRKEELSEELFGEICSMAMRFGRADLERLKELRRLQNMTANEFIKQRFGRAMDECTNEEIYVGLLAYVKEKAKAKESGKGKKKLYYISAEFLIGKLLSNNLINLGLYDEVKEELEACGKSLAQIEEIELEPSLGNGGLGRLAACFLDSIATLGLNGDGVGLNYHLGLFRQVFENNLQKEVPNPWITPESWLTRTEKSYKIHFGGFSVQSRMYDIDVVGYHNRTTKLHLFDIESVDESLVQEGIQFDKTQFAKNMTLFLYPDDSDENGRLLRVYQQYFMVSNAARLIIDECMDKGASLYDLPDYAVIQINDTHPTMVIPEMVRLLMERGLTMNEAVDVVSRMCAYTNHTILAEALEKWPMHFMQQAVPQLVPIIVELNNRVNKKFHDPSVAIINEANCACMAHIDIHYGISVNGVAALHTDILKDTELNNFYKLYPEKFNNKTNGITFRRWLLYCNPQLASFIEGLIGPGFKKDAMELEKLVDFTDDDAVLEKLLDIKSERKALLRDYLKQTQNITVDADSVFDIQVKRLHEYKRQQMNALYVIHKYFEIKAGKKPARPITVFFGAKAAPAYTIAQDIIHLILCLSQLIQNDPQVSPYLNVVMVENYNVTLAEKLIPACDISEQISLASKEASGTSNMKFMLNGAVTLGTKDGANVEIADLVGEDNIFTFGESSQTVIDRYAKGDYVSRDYYEKDENLKQAVDFIVSDELTAIGSSEHLNRLYRELLDKDWFMTFPDFPDYVAARDKALAAYEDRKAWAKMMLINISKAGFFSADRTIRQYNDEIWKLEYSAN